MNKIDSDLYINYILPLEDALKNENFEKIDFILETIYTMGMDDKTITKIDDILQEATLFSEFREEDYKIEALNLIEDFKN
ncbi:hypothetical protein BLD25_02860 [Candidatus Gracilibacteria bacterium GN02-872]|nr:hypothetical protein BLD25_02860 [Candidatus Gracilibacteria bacterium GN02-872]RKW24356.1 MAG: hypothetical protein D8B46_01605 [Candidatus Gracilibacteria bacterium]